MKRGEERRHSGVSRRERKGSFAEIVDMYCFFFIQLQSRWEEEAEKLAEDARHRLEVERRKSEEEEEGGAGGLQKESRLSDDQIERRLEERLREAQVERETRQRELIQQVGLYFKTGQQSGEDLVIANIWF